MIAQLSIGERLDAYLAEVAARLHGPRRRRGVVLAELRDGLEQAVADHLARGRTSEQAAAAAIGEFGEPRRVAGAFAGELATAWARRAIALYLLTGPLVGIWWLLLRAEPWRTGLVALIAALPVLPLIALAVVTGAGALATTGRLMRWLPEASPRRALTATAAVASLALAGDIALIAMVALTDARVRPLMLLAVGASLSRAAASGVTLAHAARIARALPVTSA
jgi:hypothetical protein